MKRLSQHIEEMKSFSEFLVPYSFPQVNIEDEEDLKVLRNREAIVDGYSVVLYYTKNNYDNYYLITLQVMSKYTPFLPFSLVCKIGKSFLGDKYLSLVEVFKESKKIYCWTLALSPKGEPIKNPYKTESENKVFEGFEYLHMNSEYVNFY
jgi:hypothetical protein